MATSSYLKPMAVVTGASSGIGLALAREFVKNGFDLLIVAEDEGIEDAARALRTNAYVEALQTDLAEPDGVEILYQAIKATGRPVDAIAINAGVGVGGPFLDTPINDELNMIELNIISSVCLAKRVLPDMVRRGYGRVLITASIVSTMPAPFEAVYGASKAFLLSFADSLRNELENTGVSVTALMPGATETNFFHRAGMDDTKVGHSKKDDPAEVAAQGFKALMDGDAHIVAASFKTKLMGAMNELMPEAIKAGMHRNMAAPGPAGKN